MKKTLSLILVMMTIQLNANEVKKPRDFVKMGNIISFNNSKYYLKSSANPSPNYFKQEYLRAKSSLDNYKEMITVDVLKGKLTLEQALKVKIQELEQLKKNNPLVNYAVYKKGESYILDFIMTDGADLFEWNLYKYIVKGKGKQQHLVLISYTYKRTIKTTEMGKQFFGYIKAQRNKMIQKLSNVNISSIRII